MGKVIPPESLSHRSPGMPATAEDHVGQALRVVVAPNAFKGSMSAVDAADAMAAGVRAALPDAVVDLAPIADGGDGSVAAFIRAGFSPRRCTSRGPTGAPVDALFAVHPGTAVVELADSCGMARLPDGRLEPMTSSTLGLGDAMRAALDTGAEEVIVCLGGSASTDGGAGLLVALGARLLDVAGREIPPSGAALADVATLDLTDLDGRLRRVRLVAAVDVDSPLTGPTGAAAVFAPQKGATAGQVDALDAALTRWATVVEAAVGLSVADVPGAGAAGGTGAALLALGAEIRPGFAEVARAIDLPGRVARADLVLTGEGRLDEQSARGKGVGGVASLAATARIPVIAVCGEITLTDEQARDLGIVARQDLRSLADSAVDAMSRASTLVERATTTSVTRWLAD